MDLSYSPNTEVCFIILLITELGFIINSASYPLLLAILIIHTTAMYQMLSEEMLQLDTEDVENIQIKNKLSLLIKRHFVIVDITNDIKSLYSISIGINFGSNTTCICFFFFLAIDELLAFLPILLYCFVIFFLYCFLGQNLMNAAALFQRSVYECGWEKFEVQEQKAIYVMLLQAQHKVEILAAGIIPVNICTFANACQFMFKFVSVFKF